MSNPPHFDEASGDLRSADGGWRIHRRFFAAVGGFLKPGGVVLLQENNAGSTPEDFRPLIEEAGLTIVFVSGAKPVRTPARRVLAAPPVSRDATPRPPCGFASRRQPVSTPWA